VIEDEHGLRFTGLAVGYRRTSVHTGLTGRARRGELTVLVGPNGAGKSTLLRTLACLQPPIAGTVRLDGTDLAGIAPMERARRLAVVLTDRVDVGLLSGRELVAIGRHPHTGPSGRLGPRDLAVVDDAIAAVGAGHLVGRRVAELSDGERQRVLTARALAQEPGLLLLDEPSAFLDVAARVALLGMLRDLARERHMGVVVSTHDLELALRLADHVWLLDRTGLRCGSPEELVVNGAVAAVFDTPALAFDPVSGTFTLADGSAGRPALVVAEQPHRALAARALARAGWRVVPTSPADAQIEHIGGDRFVVRHAGRITTVESWAALVAWARRVPAPQPTAAAMAAETEER